MLVSQHRLRQLVLLPLELVYLGQVLFFNELIDPVLLLF